MNWQTIVTDLESHSAEIRSVRTEVFVREQSIPAIDEFDQHDATCTHVLVLEKDNPVATGRLDLNQDGRIGRVAVLRSHRRRGLGTLVMKALENEAVKANISRIWFHAQVRSIGFYESLGYVVSSESEFIEEGIPHVAMEKQLLG
jgi:predicted GNAT family N-acyltransferase